MNIPRFGKVEIIYHPIIKIPNPKNREESEKIIDEITEKVRETIKTAL